MSGKASLSRLESRIEDLVLQAEDVRSTLDEAEMRPAVRVNLQRLLERLRAERKRLEIILGEARQLGIEALRWSDLATMMAESDGSDG